MARSTNIYVVTRPHYSGEDLLAAFTVKYEMKHWLSQRDTTGLTAQRIHDGGCDCCPLQLDLVTLKPIKP